METILTDATSWLNAGVTAMQSLGILPIVFAGGLFYLVRRAIKATKSVGA